MNFKVLNYELDNEQTKVVKDDSKYLFVLAGAGSGKTLTIVGKIKYLIENKHIKEDEIICITFTNMAVESLKERIRIELNKEIKCYTFHKLAMEIISDSKENYSLADDELLTMIKNTLKSGPMYYPEDQLLDQPERFVVAEIIREKILLNTDKEVPHCVAVEIESFKQSRDNPNLTEIHATIIVERDSQKKIIIGAKGQKIKEIGRLARIDISNLLGNKVYLELFVKVEPDWRNHRQQLKSLGYNKEE